MFEVYCGNGRDVFLTEHLFPELAYLVRDMWTIFELELLTLTPCLLSPVRGIGWVTVLSLRLIMPPVSVQYWPRTLCTNDAKTSVLFRHVGFSVNEFASRVMKCFSYLVYYVVFQLMWYSVSGKLFWFQCAHGRFLNRMRVCIHFYTNRNHARSN